MCRLCKQPARLHSSDLPPCYSAAQALHPTDTAPVYSRVQTLSLCLNTEPCVPLQAMQAAYGPALTTLGGGSYPLVAASPSQLGCTAYPQGTSFTGQVVLIQRGTCTFAVKVRISPRCIMLGPLMQPGCKGLVDGRGPRAAGPKP